jgi:hypothetical protein
MALQMEDALSGNVAEFGGFDGMESVLTCAKPVEHVVASCVARVDVSALIPISTVDINWTDHEASLFNPGTRKQMLSGALTGHFVFPRAREGFEPQFPQNRPP